MVQDTFRLPTSVYPEAFQEAPVEQPLLPSSEGEHILADQQTLFEVPTYGQMNHDPVLARRFYEVVSNMETMPDRRLVELGQFASDFESYRNMATEDNLSKTTLQKVHDLLKTPKLPLYVRLVDEEAIRGGKVFLRPPFTKEAPIDEDEAESGLSIESRRFWYLNQRWYYEVKYEGYEPLLIAYHIDGNKIYKAVNYQSAPLVPGEIDSLHAAAKSARDIISHGMYPVINALDDALTDLSTDDGESLDHLDYLDRLKH